MKNYMKIVSIELINFSRVYAGLGKNRVFINLDNENEITLFVGENGSGKSSVMGCFHPFAYNSAVGDNTSNSDIIMENKDGKKVVVITYGEDVYRVQHVYTRKKDGSISVKSYIMKNNEELNDSGTVTTFKQIIYKELGINETFLTLLSIGNRVDGFVEYTSGERKKYATKIFSELDVINDYYKKISLKARKIKTLLNNVTAKMSEFKGLDRTKLEISYEDAVKNLDAMNNRRLIISKELGSVEAQLKNLQETSDRYEALQQKTIVIMDKLEHNKSCQTLNCDKAKLESLKQSQLDEIKQLEIENAKQSSKLESVQDTINRLMNDNERLTTKINDIGVLGDVDDLKCIKSHITNQIAQLQQYDFSEVTKYSLDELIRSGIYLDRIEEICSGITFEVIDDDVIIKLFEKYQKDNRIFDKVQKKLENCSTKIMTYRATTSSMVNIELPVINSHDCDKCGDGCDSDCPYVTFYNTFLKITRQSSKEAMMELRDLEMEREVYQNNLAVLSIFRQVMQYISENAINIKVPLGVFSVISFMENFVRCKSVYDKDKFAYFIDLKERQNKLKELRDELNVTSLKLEKYNDIAKLLDEYNSSIIKNNSELTRLNQESENLIIAINMVAYEITSRKERLTIIENDLTAQIIIHDLSKELKLIQKEVSAMESKISKIQELKDNIASLKLLGNDCVNKIAELETLKRKTDIRLHEFINLSQEQEIIQEDYDNIMAIQDAVSPTKGIPVELIEFYMRHEMIDRMNDLLDSVYHGKFVLLKDEMVIDENEFRIPYRKNTTTVADISKASDGERAILTITFSLVLIQLSLEKYNIMLLDEIDTSLDYNTRGRFLDLLERFMSIIGSHQLFLISHNNMFDEYPINLVMTSEQNISNMKKANVIKLY